MKLDIGCGGDKRDGYYGIDLVSKPTTGDKPVDLVHDVLTGLPFEDNSIEAVYSSHLLEHIPNKTVMPLLREIHRVLVEDGIVEVLVPDLVSCMHEFLRADDSTKWGWNLATIYGLQESEGDFHKTGFDLFRIYFMLKECGFEVVNLEYAESHSQRSIYAKGIKHANPPTPA